MEFIDSISNNMDYSLLIVVSKYGGLFHLVSFFLEPE